MLTWGVLVGVITSTCFLAIWYTAGMRPEWVHDGVNTTSDHGLCLDGAIEAFELLSAETVQQHSQ